MDITEDKLLDGRVLLRQHRMGYRVGLDAALLAAACDAAPTERVIEAGCGVGGVLLSVAALRPTVRLFGVERDHHVLALAQQNIAINGLEGRADVVLGDVAEPFKALAQLPFDAALANPPYFDDDRALRGPALVKRGAWIADDGLAVWAAFLVKAVREGGTITLIHRADRLAHILQSLGPKAGSFQIRPIHPFAESAAKRVLVRAVKTGRAPLQLQPPLVLHDHKGGKHTAVTEAILRGTERLRWAI